MQRSLSARVWIYLLIGSLLISLCAVTNAFAAPALTSVADDQKMPALVASQATLQGDSPLNTSIPQGPCIIVSSLRSGAVLDIAEASTSTQAKAQLSNNAYTISQRWRIEGIGSGYYRVLNVNSGMVLSVSTTDAKPGTRVVQSAWANTSSQKWKVEAVKGGYTLTSALAGNLGLGVSKSDVGTVACVYQSKGQSGLIWKIKPIQQMLNDGVYTFTNMVSSKRMNVKGGTVDDGANVQQGGSFGAMAQSFALRYDKKTGFYKVLSSYSGLALVVASSSRANHANVQMAVTSADASQKWTISKNEDGSYTLRNAHSGMVLGVKGASSADGANIEQYAKNGSAQHWKIRAVKNWVPNGVYNIVTSSNKKLALGVADASTKANANIESVSRDDAEWQQIWIVRQDNNNPGYYTIRNLNSRSGLTAASASRGANVLQSGMKGSSNQLWKPVLTHGGIVWESKSGSKLALDMKGNGKKTGTNAQLHNRNSSYAQKFCLNRVTSNNLLKGGAFIIRNRAANVCLDIRNASIAAGAQVQLYKANGTSAQKFRITTNSNAYSLVNVTSRKAVQVSGGSFTQQAISESKAKRWAIKLDLARGTFSIQSASTGKYLANSGGVLTQVSAVSADNHRWILTPTTTDYFRVFLNSGHGWNSNGNGAFDTGAVGLGGQREADYASDLCSRIIKYARDTYGLDIVDSRPYQLAYWKRLPKAVELGCSAIFSVHFDAGGGSGPMTMVGVNGRHPASMTFNNIMGKHLYSALPGLRHRGTSYRNDITCVNGKIPAVLVEVCFMDTPSDLAYYNARKDTVARELAKGLYEASQVQSLRKSA